MKKCFKFTERNSWEGETWNFYIDMTDEQRVNLLRLIEEKCYNSSPSTYCIGEREFTHEEVAVLVSNNPGWGYMDFENYAGELVSLPDSIDWENTDPFYKGHIRDFCVRKLCQNTKQNQ